MFHKLLSNLPYSPSLIDNVADYAKQLNKETYIRRLGLTLVGFALLMQLVAAVLPSGADSELAATTVPYPNTQNLVTCSTTINCAFENQETAVLSRRTNDASFDTSYLGQNQTYLLPSNTNTALGLKAKSAQLILLAVVVYFYTRSRLLAKELDVVRKNWRDS